MRTIKRYERLNLGVQHIKLGRKSQIIKIAQSVVPGRYYVWATLLDGEKLNTWYKFVLIGMEGTIEDDELDYVGTLEGPNAPPFHLFYGVDND